MQYTTNTFHCFKILVEQGKKRAYRREMRAEEKREMRATLKKEESRIKESARTDKNK